MNSYGNQSCLCLDIACKDAHTYLKDASFTAPFKILEPFYPDSEHKQTMQIMVLCVSAGLMAGDDQRIEIKVSAGAHAQVVSQASDKVHAMPAEKRATRHAKLSIAHDASVAYTPLPIIAFADSAFTGSLEFDLQDSSSRLFYSDIFAAGRVAYGEQFLFREYRNHVVVRQAQELIFNDNAVFIPKKSELLGLTLFEGYTHTGTALLVNHTLTSGQIEQIQESCASFTGLAGVTVTGSGALCLKTLANGSEPIQNLHELVANLL